MFSRVTTVLVLRAFAAPAAAQAWTWPASGRVLRPFDYGGGTYTASGHRGIDVAGAAGSPVRAPASGQVSFAGSLPEHGKTLTIRTPDGWVVTLLHLGSITITAGGGGVGGEPGGTSGPHRVRQASAAERVQAESGRAPAIRQPRAVIQPAPPARQLAGPPADAEAPTERDFRPPWELAIAALLALLALLAVRRADPVTEEATPMMDIDALLPDNTDLLREFDAAHRACVHHARGGHPRPPSRAAGRRHVLPHRHGRERIEGVPRRRAAGLRPHVVRRLDHREVARSP